MFRVFQSLEMMTTRLLVVNSLGMPWRSRLARVGVPGDSLLLLGLAETLEQPHAAPVGVEGIDVVDDDELIPVPVELGVHPERGGVPLDPARLAVEHRPDGPALGQPPGADEDHEMEVPLCEGAQVLVEPFVGRESQHLVRGF